MQRQLELVEELIERERKFQREVTGRLVEPFDVIFDLLEQNGAMLRSQAEALGAAGQALEDAARVITTQAELFERTIGVLRQPTELTKAAAGIERRERKTREQQHDQRSDQHTDQHADRSEPQRSTSGHYLSVASGCSIAGVSGDSRYGSSFS